MPTKQHPDSGAGFWNRGPEDRATLKVALPNPEQDWEISIEPSAGHVPDGRPTGALGIPIPAKITRWHPLIRQTRSILKDCSQDEYGRYSEHPVQRGGQQSALLRITRGASVADSRQGVGFPQLNSCG
ncbi:MAG: hypothetical protein ISS31_09670 [Kiritimatiellae bacterium]|nr:hypothetical protein [Kiritimatiellia bacterium]